MVLGWRRAFCTSIPRDREPPVIKEKQEHHHHQQQSNTTNSSPKLSSKFGGFFSNSTTPRLQTPPVSSPGLRCLTTATATATVPAASVPESPKLQRKTAKNSPRFFHRSSNPSSPRSTSTFSLLKSSLRLSKSRCGICLQSVKTGQGMAIFTAECSHTFHFPCIASHMKKQSQMECPVCSSIWKEMPLLSIHNQKSSSLVDRKKKKIAAKIDVDVKANNNERKHYLRSDLKVYNDDEPLMSPTSVARFNPIPESDENGDEDSEIGVEDFQGFSVNASTSPIEMNSKNVEVRLLPEAAVVSIGRSYETYAIILKVRAPPVPKKASRRAPIDLVTVLDASESMNSEKMQMMKRAMRLVVSSLSSADRLSIVAFSATSKRLLPLRRMTTNGRRSARRIIDPLAVLEGTSSASDALKKAAKVLEERRERNPAGCIMLLSDRHDDRSSANQRRQSSFVSSTRYSHVDIPVHSIEFNHEGMCGNAPTEDAFVKCVGDLLSIVVQDLRLHLGFASDSAPAEIAAVYSYTFRAACLGSGSPSPKVGDLYAEEERELLVELKVPSSAIGAHHVLSVRCNYTDPSTQEVIHGKEQALLVPHPHAVKSSAPSIQRLRNLFLATRALAESRRLVERSDLTGAHHMLSSARALLLQSSSASAKEFVNSLKAELSELHQRCQSQNQRSATTLVTRREISFADENGEPPTSAWRAAERLAKVGIMRKSLNRVSDLHGFEDARF